MQLQENDRKLEACLSKHINEARINTIALKYEWCPVGKSTVQLTFPFVRRWFLKVSDGLIMDISWLFAPQSLMSPSRAARTNVIDRFLQLALFDRFSPVSRLDVEMNFMPHFWARSSFSTPFLTLTFHANPLSDLWTLVSKWNNGFHSYHNILVKKSWHGRSLPSTLPLVFVYQAGSVSSGHLPLIFAVGRNFWTFSKDALAGR